MMMKRRRGKLVLSSRDGDKDDGKHQVNANRGINLSNPKKKAEHGVDNADRFSEADDRPEATDLLTFCQLPMRPNRSTGHEAGLAGQWVRAFQEALLLQKAARKESATSKPRQLEPRRVRPKPVSKVTKKRLLTYNISKAYGARTAQIILLAPI